MSNNVDIIIAKVVKAFRRQHDAGLFSEDDLYSDAISELKRFGNDVCILQECFVEVKNGFGELPQQYWALNLAMECQPSHFERIGTDDGELQTSLFYRERTVLTDKWNECDTCCKEQSESVIRENIYLRTGALKFYYHKPRKLRLAKQFMRSGCKKSCQNTPFENNKNEINIIGTTLQANYNEGDIYMKYYGLPVDDEGNIDVPDTKNGHLAKYLEFYLKRTTAEYLITSAGASELQSMFSYFREQEGISLRNTTNELKMSKINPKSMQRLKLRNKLQTLTFEIETPSWQ